MNPLHVITGLNDGGAERVLYNLCRFDPEDTHTVVSLLGPGVYTKPLLDLGVAVHHLDMSRGRADVASLGRLWRLIRTRKPDVVQTWMYHADLVGGLVARIANARAVVWGIHHTDLAPAYTKLSTRYTARACAVLSRTVPTRIVCCAEAALSSHGRLGYDVRRMTVIENGYDFEEFVPNPGARDSLRSEFGIRGDEVLVGMVARVEPQKDHASLLDALRLLMQRGVHVRCALVGRGAGGENAVLREAIASRGLDDRVLLVGPRDDIGRVMNALDIHVLSSRTEGFPNVIAEAMACGTPCITTDVGDAARIVGKTGWTVQPSDPTALADAVQDAVTELRQFPLDWQRRRLRSRERCIDRFGIARMVAGYRRVWRESLLGRDAQ